MAHPPEAFQGECALGPVQPPPAAHMGADGEDGCSLVEHETFFKKKRELDPKYIAFVKKCPCELCGVYGVDPSHPRGLAWGCGTGLKSDDKYAIPLCRPHHDEYHRGQDTFEARYLTHEELLRRFRKRHGLPQVR